MPGRVVVASLLNFRGPECDITIDNAFTLRWRIPLTIGDGAVVKDGQLALRTYSADWWLEYRGPEIRSKYPDPQDPDRWARDLMTKAVVLLRLLQPSALAQLYTVLDGRPIARAQELPVMLKTEEALYDLSEHSMVERLQTFWQERCDFLRSGDLESFAFWLDRASVTRLTSLTVFHWVQALESILLPETGPDMRYRFALRGALIAKSFFKGKTDPQTVYHDLYQAYGLRNKCAHGVGLHEMNQKREEDLGGMEGVLRVREWTNMIVSWALTNYGKVLQANDTKRADFYGALCDQFLAGAEKVGKDVGGE